MPRQDFFEKKRLIGNSSVLIIFDRNYSSEDTIARLVSDMNFLTFWIRREQDGLFSVRTIQSIDLDHSIKLGGVFDAEKLGRLMRFWVSKGSGLAEAWKEEITKAHWEDTARIASRNRFRRQTGASLERVFRSQWRNVFNRMRIIQDLIKSIKSESF